jgi:hypothetical protein
MDPRSGILALQGHTHVVAFSVLLFSSPKSSTNVQPLKEFAAVNLQLEHKMDMHMVMRSLCLRATPRTRGVEVRSEFSLSLSLSLKAQNLSTQLYISILIPPASFSSPNPSVFFPVHLSE